MRIQQNIGRIPATALGHTQRTDVAWIYSVLDVDKDDTAAEAPKTCFFCPHTFSISSNTKFISFLYLRSGGQL
jgi:hypothetical protein